VSSYLGETAANLRKVFDFARTRPMVVLFDEFDAIGKDRASEEEHGEIKRVVNSFLQMMDGFRSETIMIAATNHEGLLDPALWRRFDEIVFFRMPDVEVIEELLVRNLRQMGVSPAVQLREVARTLTGMSHADVERLALDAVKETLLQDRREVDRETLGNAVKRQKERVRVTRQGKARTGLETDPPATRRHKRTQR
jgi:AAA+ superfamily predicted ATPase